MKKDFYNQVLGHQTGTTLGSELLRDALIPSLVGNNDDIMYWAGKLLARKLLLATDNDLRLFFEYAGWGTLTHTKSKKEEHTFELSGEPVKVRFSATEKPDFQLEAGFIAETFQLHSNFTTEAKVEKTDDKKDVVTISVIIDSHAPVQPESTDVEPFSMIEFDKLQKEAQKVDSDKED
ncbi:MAG TPA: YslB family protein [Candidatus Ligilactobacillus faecavium]|nr:YslB family protein [Candidatus Ligilactobacillus faecavium]